MKVIRSPRVYDSQPDPCANVAGLTEQLELNQKSACTPHTNIPLVSAGGMTFRSGRVMPRIILSRSGPCVIFFVVQVEIVWEKNGRVCSKVKG